jgi:hypothetical protein
VGTTLEQTNGHGGEVGDYPTYTSGVPTGTGGGVSEEPTKPVPFRLPAREKFTQAARRAKMSMKDAADLAADLLDAVTQDEKPETPAERKARLLKKAMGK